MRTMHFRVGIDGDIDETRSYLTEREAIHAAKFLAEIEDFSEKIAVYGFQSYSIDDPTPIYARTEFWRHWMIDPMGRISPDGR